MNKLSVALRVAAVAAALLAAIGWMLIRGKLNEKQSEIQILQAGAASLRVDLADSRDRSASLESDLNTSRSELALSKQRATEFQDQYFLATQEVAKLQNSIAEEKRLLANLTRDNEQLKQEIVTVKTATPPERDRSGEIEAYKRRVTDMESEIGDLQARLAGAPMLPASRDAQQDPGSIRDQPKESEAISATIASVKRDLGMMVLDQGSGAGIRLDQEFKVVRNGQEIGKIRLTVVNEVGSVGTLISSTAAIGSLNIGDSIWLIQ